MTVALNSRLIRSMIGGAVLSCLVSDRRLRRVGRATSSWRTIDASTVFFDTRQPHSRRSSRTRGEP